MKKIIVIGCPGSGKSTFARALNHKTVIPLVHLDMLFWNADKTAVERSIFLERLVAVLEKDEWIIDGNYASTMEQRIAACDTGEIRNSADSCPQTDKAACEERSDRTEKDSERIEYLPKKTIEQN